MRTGKGFKVNRKKKNMSKKLILVEKITINKNTGTKYFQIRLPANTKQVTGVAIGIMKAK
jgi:hypothetical protein